MVERIDECRNNIEENFRPAGYNIGYNGGEAAGQTVMHCHCHFIPRYRATRTTHGEESAGL
jgi:diadenosine tetraphosphate (Ap4A) HIT family hydrolase